jgi:ABC-2 type transport system permease protein
MKTLKYLLQKEFRQIFRNPSILRVMFIAPMLQLIIIPLAADYEVRNINLVVLDHDHSTMGAQLINKIAASTYFKLVDYTSFPKKAYSSFDADKADIVLEIPASFEKTMVREGHVSPMLTVNAVNGVKANLGAAYLQSIIQDYNASIRLRWIDPTGKQLKPNLQISTLNRFNPFMNYKLFMAPGILVTLLTLVGSFLTALNIVREKEIGTIEQINVTPVRKSHFILGKLIPFWVIGMMILTMGLILLRIIYHIVPAGNILWLYLFAAIYLMAVLGLGLLISTFADTQQQALLIAFFLFMIFILLGGLFTPIDSMPPWVQKVTWFNPVSYFIDVVRMIILKGSSLADIKYHILAMLGFAGFLNGWAVINYRKRS